MQYMSEAWDEIANTVNSLRMMDESNNGSNDDPNKEFNLEKTEKNENNI